MDMSYCATAGFAPVYNFDHDQRNAMHSAMQFPSAGQYMHPSLTGLQYMSNPFFQSRHIQMPDRGVLGDAKNESKPRLSKEEVDQLEKVFQENPKPSSSLKAQLADRLGLERPRINVPKHQPLVTLETHIADISPELVPEPPSKGEAGEEAGGVRGLKGS